jgi:hypothetical protein
MLNDHFAERDKRMWKVEELSKEISDHSSSFEREHVPKIKVNKLED